MGLSPSPARRLFCLIPQAFPPRNTLDLEPACQSLRLQSSRHMGVRAVERSILLFARFRRCSGTVTGPAERRLVFSCLPAKLAIFPRRNPRPRLFRRDDQLAARPALAACAGASRIAFPSLETHLPSLAETGRPNCPARRGGDICRCYQMARIFHAMATRNY